MEIEDLDLRIMIRERLGYPNYIGFRMDKTHSQEETNKEITRHNKEILEKFSDLDINIEKVKRWLDCWKGIVFFSPTGEFNDNIKEFGGWESDDILYWILTEGRYYLNGETKPEEISRIITKQQRFSVLKRQKWRCNQCNTQLKFSKNSSWEGEVAHTDHIHPYSKRKTYPNGEQNINELSNLQALCPKCNLTKNDKKIH